MIEIEIEQTNNRNVDDFVYIDDIRENKNGVVDIRVRSDRFKYWDIDSQSGCSTSNTAVTINNMVHYKKGTLYRIEDWYDVPEDEMELETFCFTVSFDEKDRNDWAYYEYYITPLKYEYEIKLVPRSLLETFNENGEPRDWDEFVLVDEEEMQK